MTPAPTVDPSRGTAGPSRRVGLAPHHNPDAHSGISAARRTNGLASTAPADDRPCRGAVVFLVRQWLQADLVEWLGPRTAGGQTPCLACSPAGHTPPSRGSSRLFRIAPEEQPEEGLRVWLGPGRVAGRLRLWWHRRSIARIARFAALAGPVDPDTRNWPAQHPDTGLYHPEFLGAALSLSAAQARRRGEPLSLLIMQIESPPAEGHAADASVLEAAWRRAARAVVTSVRSSDLVSCLDERQLAVMLSGADAVDASRIARTLQRVVAESAVTSGLPQPLAATVGLASDPTHARGAGHLLAAARTSLLRACRDGPGSIRSASPLRKSGSALFATELD